MHKFASLKHLLGMLLLYFVGYLILLPTLMTRFTLMIHPSATHFHPLVLLLGYFVYTLILIIFTYKIWKKSFYQSMSQLKQHFILILKSSIFILIVNGVLSIVIGFIFQSSGSSNQQEIQQQSFLYPNLTLFITCVIAPMIEEMIFRSSFFECDFLKRYPTFTLWISSLLFGWIHVMDSLFSIGLSELGYFFIYTMIGLVLGYSYQRSQSLFVCIFIHAINNVIACMIMYS